LKPSSNASPAAKSDIIICTAIRTMMVLRTNIDLDSPDWQKAVGENQKLKLINIKE
jgi:hypothetical protein